MLTLDKPRWRVYRSSFQFSHRCKIFQITKLGGKCKGCKNIRKNLNGNDKNKTTNPYLSNSENVKPLYKKSKQSPR